MNIVLTGGTSGLGYRTAEVLGKEIKNKIILRPLNINELSHKLDHNYFLLKLFTSLGKGENLSWVLGEFIAQSN